MHWPFVEIMLECYPRLEMTYKTKVPLQNALCSAHSKSERVSDGLQTNHHSYNVREEILTVPNTRKKYL